MLYFNNLQNARWDNYVGDVAPTDSKLSERVVYKVSVSNIPLDAKPDKNTKEGQKQIRQLSGSFRTAELTIEEILDKVLKGYSISNIVWNGKRSAKNFTSSQLQVLDFDNDLFFKKGIGPNVSPEMFVERLRNRGLDCSFIWSSLNDSPERRKFRVVWLCDEVCKDAFKAKILLKGLINEFDGDTATTGLAQFFYPCKGILYSNPEYVLSRKDGSLDNFEFELLKGFEKSTLAQLNRDALSDDFFPDILYNTYSKAGIIESKYRNRKIEIKRKDRFRVFEDFRLNSKLMDDFMIGKLKYGHLKILATNLYPFEGSKEMIINRMNEYGKSSNTPYVFDDYRLVHDIFRVGYLPMNLQFHLKEKYKNFLEIFKIKVTLKEVELIPFEDARRRLDEEIYKYFNEPKPFKIKVIRAEVGLGKTTSLLKYIKDIDCLIGFPVHALKDEKAQLLEESGIRYRVTQELPKDIDEKIYEEIQACYKVGDPRLANRKIHSHIKESKSPALVKKLKDFIQNNEKAMESNGITLTTHSKLLYCDTSKDIIISDEDLINQLLEVETIDWADFLALTNLIKSRLDNDIFEVFENQLNNLEENTNKVTFTEVSRIDSATLETITELISNNYKLFKGPIVKFLQSKYCIRSGQSNEKIHFLKVNTQELSPFKSYLILSATANEEMYRVLERDGFEVEFVEIPRCIHNSTIYQDTTYSNSQSSLKNRIDWESYRKAVDQLNVPVITHKAWKKQFRKGQKEMEIHFNKCSGFDSLFGSDIAVIGSIHRPTYNLALLACYFDEALVGQELPKPEMLYIESNAAIFRYLSYENPIFRMTHQFYLEEAIIQAVGRARYIHIDVNIYILSSYVIFHEYRPFEVLKDNEETDLPEMIEQEVVESNYDFNRDDPFPDLHDNSDEDWKDFFFKD